MVPKGIESAIIIPLLSEKTEVMSKAVEYRKHAQECRALARNVQNEEHKGQLLKMAQAWDSFATQHERSEPAQTLAKPTNVDGRRRMTSR